MTKETYVKAIIKKLKCSGKKKKEFKQQLLSDIEMALENGEDFSKVMTRMGSVAEISAEFNENMAPTELRKHKQIRIFTITGAIAIVLLLLSFGIYWFLPKPSQVKPGDAFEEVLVRAQMENVIQWVTEEDYEQLMDHSIPMMQSFFNGEDFDKTKDIISTNWGTLESCSNFYLTQIKQYGKDYVVGQVNVSYENVSVSYTITLDKDLNLAGLYMK